MEPNETAIAEGGDGEEEHIGRLMALLHERVRREEGRRGAARALGIDRRIVGACMDGGGLRWRPRETQAEALQEVLEAIGGNGKSPA